MRLVLFMNTVHGNQKSGCEFEMGAMGSLQREFMFNKALILVCFSSLRVPHELSMEGAAYR